MTIPLMQRHPTLKCSMLQRTWTLLFHSLWLRTSSLSLIYLKLKIVFIVERKIQFRGHTGSGETGCVWSVLRTPEDCLVSLDTVTYHQPSLPPLPLASTRWAPTNERRRVTEVGGECLYGQHLARHRAASPGLTSRTNWAIILLHFISKLVSLFSIKLQLKSVQSTQLCQPVISTHGLLGK